MAQAAIRQPTPLDTVNTRQNSRRTLGKFELLCKKK